MTDTIVINNGRLKKAYSVTIRERQVINGKVTKHSLTSTSFQIKDIGGDTNIMLVKVKLMEIAKRKLQSDKLGITTEREK